MFSLGWSCQRCWVWNLLHLSPPWGSGRGWRRWERSKGDALIGALGRAARDTH